MSEENNQEEPNVPAPEEPKASSVPADIATNSVINDPESVNTIITKSDGE